MPLDHLPNRLITSAIMRASHFTRRSDRNRSISSESVHSALRHCVCPLIPIRQLSSRLSCPPLRSAAVTGGQLFMISNV